MFCRNCRKEVAEQAVMCVSCGCQPMGGGRYCQHCGADSNPGAQACVKCGLALTSAVSPEAKSRLAAGLLGILLGGLGVHRFYLGYVGIGIAQVAVSLVTLGFGAIWGFIEGILILTGSMNKDAKGNPLRD